MTTGNSRAEAHRPVWSGPLFLAIVATVLTVNLAAYVYELRQPNLGFTLTPGGLVVAVDPGGPADQAGVRESDELLLLNGVSPHDVDAYGAARSAIAPGQTVRVSVLREDGEVLLDLQAGGRSVLLEGYVVGYLAAGFFLLLGALVYLAVRGAPLGWVYFLFMAACALALACTVPTGSRGFSVAAVGRGAGAGPVRPLHGAIPGRAAAGSPAPALAGADVRGRFASVPVQCRLAAPGARAGIPLDV